MVGEAALHSGPEVLGHGGLLVMSVYAYSELSEPCALIT